MHLLRSIYRFLSSMKTGLILLVIIGLISAIGSATSPGDFFHGTVFKLSLLLLLLNMSLCTFSQIRRYWSLRQKSEKEQTRNPFRYIGILALHAGIVMILIGGVINAFAGQDLPVRIIQGETINISESIPDVKPFEVKLDEFKIDFNEDGSPSQYFSHVSLLDGGKVLQKFNIFVNNPLNFRGVKAYQHSYGYLVNVKGESNSGWTEQKTLAEGDLLPIEGSRKTIRLFKYIPNFDPQYGMNTKTLRPDNPRVIYSIYDNDMLIKAAAVVFGEKIEIDPGIYITFTDLTPFTVLTVKRDPGLLTVSVGGLLLMVGTCLALFLKQRKQGEV